MKKTIVYYFSGTGNSLVVAERIKKRLDDVKLIEMSSALQQKDFKTKAKTIGFVFPCHDYTLPVPVKKFLKKLEMPKVNYIFAVATRSNTDVKAFKKIEKRLKKQDKVLNASFVIDMPSNDPRPKEFKEPVYEDIKKIDKKIDKMVSNIKYAVINKEEHHDNAMLPDGAAKKEAGMLKKAGIITEDKKATAKGRYFYVTDDCIGCGVCQKVCMSGKIKMDDGKPKWRKGEECYACFACINFCPVSAIQIHSTKDMESHTEENGRYHHPHVTYKDMLYRKKTK